MKKICYITTIAVSIRAFFIPQLIYLQENGFDVTVICSPDEKLQEELGENIRFLPIDMPRGISVKGSMDAIRQLKHIFKQEKFDLVQYSTPNAALYASIAAQSVGIPIRNYHLMGFRYLGAQGIGRVILRCIEKVACKYSTNIECVSKSNLELGVKDGIFRRDKAIVVWNGSSGGVNLQKFDCEKRKQWRREIRSELGIEPETYLVGFIGRITRDKGVNELLEAFFEVENEVELLIVGEEEGIDTLNQPLWERAKQSSGIHMHEPVQDIERYYAAIDLLILPSYREGFGNVVIEAAAVGTPAIVTNIPGPIDAVKQGKTAWVVNKGDVKELTGLIKKSAKREIELKASDCCQFVKESFDSLVLREKILERKKELLKI